MERGREGEMEGWREGERERGRNGGRGREGRGKRVAVTQRQLITGAHNLCIPYHIRSPDGCTCKRSSDLKVYTNEIQPSSANIGECQGYNEQPQGRHEDVVKSNNLTKGQMWGCRKHVVTVKGQMWVEGECIPPAIGQTAA